MSKILVKDTQLSLVRPGDILLYKAEGLQNGDFLGELIATFEGGQGRYTHAAIVRDAPDPNAACTEVRPGIFKVDETKTIEKITRETQFQDEVQQGEVLRNTMGVKLESTFPTAREWGIDWENAWMEVWRIRDLMPENVRDILRQQQDMAGFLPFDAQGNHPDAWDYNIAEFLTYGLLNQAAAKICSQFVADPVYTSTLLRGCANGNYALPMTPDLRGNRDPEKTPNDLIMSGFAWPVPFQGLLEAAS